MWPRCFHWIGWANSILALWSLPFLRPKTSPVVCTDHQFFSYARSEASVGAPPMTRFAIGLNETVQIHSSWTPKTYTRLEAFDWLLMMLLNLHKSSLFEFPTAFLIFSFISYFVASFFKEFPFVWNHSRSSITFGLRIFSVVFLLCPIFFSKGHLRLPKCYSAR